MCKGSFKQHFIILDLYWKVCKAVQYPTVCTYLLYLRHYTVEPRGNLALHTCPTMDYNWTTLLCVVIINYVPVTYLHSLSLIKLGDRRSTTFHLGNMLFNSCREPHYYIFFYHK